MGDTIQAWSFIDIHAHVIPGVDDGARDMEEASQMLVQASLQGVSAVIATPHSPGGASVQKLGEKLESLQKAIQEKKPGFSVYSGQEHFYHEGLIDELRAGTALTLAGSSYVLVEFDPAVSYQALFRGIRQLIAAGYIPVLAHMERYRCIRQEKNLQDLEGSRCKFQMNYSSIQGNRFQPDVHWCRKQIKEGRIHLLGTDMHRVDYRPPDFTKALWWLEKHVDRDYFERLTRRNAMHIINNEKIS